MISFSRISVFVKSLMLFCILLYAIVPTNCDNHTEHGLIVQTKLGKLQGSVMTTDKNNEFHAFRGIPFAKPPLKDLRFKAPVPPDSWNDTRDATHNAYDCLQFEFVTKSFMGDEDCLYLNVYTPAIISYDHALPVMVFIYGGGFSSGSGSSSVYGPQRLLDKDVVLVTINYRIGILGFLSTEDISSPGNYGLLDQVQALRWVQQNIHSFGGDPNRVTIFGESAGSASVFYHMVSPLSKGLFHGVIGQSGAPFSIWGHDAKPLKAATTLGERIGCPTECTTKLVECLRKQPALDLLIKSSLVGMVYSPVKTSPVTDVQYGGSFISENPYLLLKTNRFNKVPVIGGICKDEGILMHLIFSAPFGDIKVLNETFVASVFPVFFPSLSKDSATLQKILEYIRTNYFQNATSWQERLAAFSEFFGDSMISSDMDVTLSMLAKHNHPTYAYKFSYRGEHSASELFTKDPDVIKELSSYVAHVDDLQYLFRSEFFKVQELNEKDQKMADIILDLWTNFARTGVPTSKDSTVKHPDLEWNQLTAESFSYLNLGLDSKMVDSHLTGDSWHKLYKTVLLKSLSLHDDHHNPIIETKFGKIKGSVLKSDKGADIFAFRGIPYAQPPVKDLRFEAPRPTTPWTGVLDATEDGHNCLQWDFFTYHLQGDEDCLFVNVYTTKLPTQNETEKRPVMVEIHGGGFLSGSGSSALYGPQRLMDKDVIVVSVNYRMGPMGFFSTGDEVAPGNYGMLDQVAALQWVHDHIESFGGDPNRVTIFGQSAGSSSVLMHILSPLSKGLFHAAIAQSGSPSSSWSIEDNPADNVKFVASLTNCPSHSSTELVACLKSKSALDILFPTTQKDYLSHIGKKYVYRFKPVVDKVAGNASFLPEHPSKLILDGNLNEVPIMIGTTKDEGSLFYGYVAAMMAASHPGLLDSANMEKLMPWLLSFPFKSEEQSLAAAKKIRKEYFDKDSTPGLTDAKGFIAILGDAELIYDVSMDVEILSKRGINPFVYSFDYLGERSFSDVDQMGKQFVPKELGSVGHLDDTRYIFHFGYFKTFDLTPKDSKMADILLTLLTNFAKTRVPSLGGSTYEHQKFVWKSSTTAEPRYLELNLTPKMVDGSLCQKHEFWKSIFPQTSKQDYRV